MLLDDSELEGVNGGMPGGMGDPVIMLGGISYFSHKIVKNDTLSRLALRYHTSVDELKRLNNITNPDLIELDHTILIPLK